MAGGGSCVGRGGADPAWGEEPDDDDDDLSLVADIELDLIIPRESQGVRERRETVSFGGQEEESNDGHRHTAFRHSPGPTAS